MLSFLAAVPKKRTVKLGRKKGVLFHNLNMGQRTFFYTASFGMVAAILFGIYWFEPIGEVYGRYLMNQIPFNQQQQSENLAKANQQISQEIVANDDYSLIIPKIKAQAAVVAGVSAFDRNQYTEVLDQNKVAQTDTSTPPGSGKGTSTFIFAHSSAEGLTARKNAVFYLLGELKKGDTVWVTYQGKKYFYKVYQSKVIKATETSYLSYHDNNKEVLILQTCWPVGTDWNRLLVLAELLAY